MVRTLSFIFLLALVFCLTGGAAAQQVAATAASAPQTITFQDALGLARKNSVDFNAAQTDHGLAREDRRQAQAALLPSVNYNNQFLYTEGRGGAARFVASNGVHEYVSQGNAHEGLGVSDIANYRRAQALESAARARAGVAERGLVVTVVQAYYGLIAAQRKYASVQEASAEAARFMEISQKLETGGEVAQSDVIKAQIQSQDRRRDFREAQLTMDRARLDLAVLIFADFNQNFTVVDDLEVMPALAEFSEFERAAQANNLDLKASNASFKAAQLGVTSARGGYLPSLSLDYFYGIDASQFATRTGGVRNLGYSATATLNIPVWNWGTTRSRVTQAGLRRDQAQRELSQAQRRLLAQIRLAYGEADAARSELDLLKSSAELAAQSQRLTTLRYQSGEASVLEVVDAQNTLTQSRNAFHDGEVRYRTALASLQVLTGTM
ncbi:MAG TPA: TolC family protein [Candidatus Saccharimonadales bacterium]|nr:TolC family protein [Candidatus Saccharimonadales bacterium]